MIHKPRGVLTRGHRYKLLVVKNVHRRVYKSSSHQVLENVSWRYYLYHQVLSNAKCKQQADNEPEDPASSEATRESLRRNTLADKDEETTLHCLVVLCYTILALSFYAWSSLGPKYCYCISELNPVVIYSGMALSSVFILAKALLAYPPCRIS